MWFVFNLLKSATKNRQLFLIDHLEKLRWHLIRSMVAIVTFTIVSFVFVKWIFNNIILGPAKSGFWTWRMLCKIGQRVGSPDLCIADIPLELQSRLMTGQFTITIISAFVLGLIISFPYVAWEIWQFIRPNLQLQDRRNSTGAVAIISILFLAGLSFGYFFIVPLMVYVMVNYQVNAMIINQFDITSYVSTVIALVFGCGVLFELPVFIYFLSKVGLVTPAFLRKYRKHAMVIILIVSAIITPPDPLSQTLIALPLFVLYEISILISARVERQRNSA
jgi:sec-independent protein translocase protein TatC